MLGLARAGIPLAKFFQFTNTALGKAIADGTGVLIRGYVIMEFLNGQPLSPEDLDRLRMELESFDDISAVSDEVRGIVKRNWPHLLAKLPPEPGE